MVSEQLITEGGGVSKGGVDDILNRAVHQARKGGKPGQGSRSRGHTDRLRFAQVFRRQRVVGFVSYNGDFQMNQAGQADGSSSVAGV